jgi:hypothetical protein
MLKERTAMTINLRSVLLLAAGAAMFGGAWVCSAQEVNAVSEEPTRVNVTAGQGGAMWVPVPAAAPHALTGEASESRQALRAWQREAGPVYSVGNARIILPASR